MVYLDNAATTFPKPGSVSKAVYDFMRTKAANPGRSGHRLSMAAAEEIYLCRDAVAALFNAPGPECVAFTLNATYAINMVLKGALKAGGHVVTSDLEHNAVMRPLYKLSQNGVTYSTARVDLEDDEKTVLAFKEAIRDDTVMVACTHASNLCGRLLPIKQIGELCRSKGIKFLVDASQTAGIVPIDMRACYIDYLCMPGHKCLYGPMGTGLLVVADGSEIDTIIEGGTGSNSLSLEQPDFMPDRFESGTVNAPGIAGLRAGIGYVNGRSITALYRHEHELALMLFDALSNINGITLYTKRPESGYVPVIPFNIGGLSSSEAAVWLDRHGFALRGGMHCTPAAHSRFGTTSQGMLRASFGAFNTESDVTRLKNALRQISNGQI